MVIAVYLDMDMKNAVFFDVPPCSSCVTSQRMAFFIVTAVKTSDLTYTDG
jgi:hypothetical protein